MNDVPTLTLAADQVTPVRAYAALRSFAPLQSSFLFESVVTGDRDGRFSIVGYRAETESLYPPAGDALGLLLSEMRLSPRLADDPKRSAAESLAIRLSLASVGYLTHEAAYTQLGIKPWEDERARARLFEGSTVVVFDHRLQTLSIAGPTRASVNRCAWELTHGPELRLLRAPRPDLSPEHVDPLMNDQTFLARMRRAKEKIVPGVLDEVVLGRTFRSPPRSAELFDVYRALRVLMPSPSLFFVDFVGSPMAPPLSLLGASPFALVGLDDGRMALRPFADTSARGGSRADDDARAQALLDDASARGRLGRQQALGRADIAKVCAEVLEGVATVEAQGSSLQLAGEVRGNVNAGVHPVEVIRAALPASATTGAPKAAAAKVIRELEAGSRGLFGSALGFLLPDGDPQLALAHRVIVLQDAYLEVSAGVSVDSSTDPETGDLASRLAVAPLLAAIRVAQDAADARAAADAEKAAKAAQVAASAAEKKADD